MIIASNIQTFYAVKVNGRIVSMPTTDRYLAETVRHNLPPDQRPIAEVVIVTQSGQELLLG